MGLKYPLIKPNLGKEELDAVQNVFSSGYLTEGPETKSFQSEFAAYCDSGFGVAFTSCTTALETALRACGIGPGDEVIVPDYTYPATAQAVYLVGATPILVDIDCATFNVDYDELEKAITPQTRALMPVSLFGNPLDYTRLNALKEKHNLLIIEDAACSVGAETGGKRVGSQADITCFSLHPRKAITTGEGGMATTNNEELAQKMIALKHFGMVFNEERHKVEFFHKVATNYKMPNILAAIGRVQLKKADAIIQRRTELAQIYDGLIDSVGKAEKPSVADGDKHVYQSYCLLLDESVDRDALIKKMREHEIETQIGTYALSLQPAFKDTKKVGTLSNSQKAFKHALVLPMSHDLTPEDQEFVVSKLNEEMGE